MKRALLGLIGLGVMAGCGKEPVSLEDIPDIDGAWSFQETIAGGPDGMSCQNFGTFSFSQKKDTFVGSFTRTENCSRPAEAPSATSRAGLVSGGEVQPSNIKFRIGDCDYRGVFVTVDPPGRLNGNLLCTTIRLDATIASTSGTWVADRVTEAEGSGGL